MKGKSIFLMLSLNLYYVIYEGTILVSVLFILKQMQLSLIEHYCEFYLCMYYVDTRQQARMQRIVCCGLMIILVQRS